MVSAFLWYHGSNSDDQDLILILDLINNIQIIHNCNTSWYPGKKPADLPHSGTVIYPENFSNLMYKI
jgi:hypothetical protein